MLKTHNHKTKNHPTQATVCRKVSSGRKAGERLVKTVLIAIIVLGTAIFLYPVVSNWLSQKQHQNAINTYTADIQTLPQDICEEEWRKAMDYNNSLMGNPVQDPFIPGSGAALTENYMTVLNRDGIMGYLDIPVIDVHLPVYHGTSEAVLSQGVGHLENTALPTGGKGLNPILSAHTGLPKSKLFTDLHKLKTGDLFSLHVLDKTMTYKVTDIQVILPEETARLTSEKDKDYVTLLTCTPYGINSHRLAVRGERCYELSESFHLDNGFSLVEPLTLIGSSLILSLLLCMVIGRKGIRHFYGKAGSSGHVLFE